MMVSNDLVEISLRDGDVEVNLRRPNVNGQVSISPAEGQLPAQVAPVPTVPAAAPAASSAPPPVEEEDADLVAISSPMVGTFYTAADPDSPPFVTPGSEVHADTVVCILEAMKVFNEIKAEIAGRIERILVKNAQPVEYGQPLFLVRPS